MRALSQRQASRCETAKTKICRCRCGGQLHGAFRNFIEEDRQALPEAEFFEALPQVDPHHIRSQEEKRALRKLARENKKPQMSLFGE